MRNKQENRRIPLHTLVLLLKLEHRLPNAQLVTKTGKQTFQTKKQNLRNKYSIASLMQ